MTREEYFNYLLKCGGIVKPKVAFFKGTWIAQSACESAIAIGNTPCQAFERLSDPLYVVISDGFKPFKSISDVKREQREQQYNNIICRS